MSFAKGVWSRPPAFVLLLFPVAIQAAPTLEVVPEWSRFYTGLEYRVTVRLEVDPGDFANGVERVSWTFQAPGTAGDWELGKATLPTGASDFFGGKHSAQYAMATETHAVADGVLTWTSERAIEPGTGESRESGDLGSYRLRVLVPSDQSLSFSVLSAEVVGRDGESYTLVGSTLTVASPSVEVRVKEPSMDAYLLAFQPAGSVLDVDAAERDWDLDGFPNRAEWAFRQRPDVMDTIMPDAGRFTSESLSIKVDYSVVSDLAALGFAVVPQVSLDFTGTAWSSLPSGSISEIGSFPGGKRWRADFKVPDYYPHTYYRLLLEPIESE